jgi:hypothetical protein
MTVPVVFAIAGVAALFFSIWGRGLKAKEVEIPPPPRQARLIVGFVGFVFIGVSIWLSIPNGNVSKSSSINFPASAIPTSAIPTPTAVDTAEATVSRSQINEWLLGETTEANTVICLEESGKLSEPEIYFEKGSTVPKGVLLATGFWGDSGTHWNQLPVKPICAYNDWGLFESLDDFQAVNGGGYRIIIP